VKAALVDDSIYGKALMRKLIVSEFMSLDGVMQAPLHYARERGTD
jgi:hypothetical protein